VGEVAGFKAEDADSGGRVLSFEGVPEKKL